MSKESHREPTRISARKPRTAEFGFLQELPAPAPRAQAAVIHTPKTASAPAEQDGPATIRTAAFTPQPNNETQRMNNTPNNPTPINGRTNIDRQAREQRMVNNMLNGVAIAVMCGILFVAALAGTGGYVLWRQIQDQSATISVLETNMKERINGLEDQLSAKDAELAKTLAASSVRLTNLQSEFEDYRSQTSQSIAQLSAANQRLEQKLLAQQKILAQNQLVAANDVRFRR
jgi:hypothetical protein